MPDALEVPVNTESDSGASRSPKAPSGPIVRWALRIATGGILFTAIAGALHMPFARPLLRMLSPASVCPIMRGSPEQIDRAHAVGAAAIRSTAVTAAPSRPALGFELDKTRKSDMLAWAASHKVSCESIAGNDNLQRCGKVPASAVLQPDAFGPLEEVTFEFQKTGELVHVQTMRRHLTAEVAAYIAGQLETNAAHVLGPPSTRGGAPTVAHLSHGLLSTYVATHTFTDYRSTVTATNLAETGMMVREEYLSVR